MLARRPGFWRDCAVRAAIRNGQVASLDELIDRALAGLPPSHREPTQTNAPGSLFARSCIERRSAMPELKPGLLCRTPAIHNPSRVEEVILDLFNAELFLGPRWRKLRVCVLAAQVARDQRYHTAGDVVAETAPVVLQDIAEEEDPTPKPTGRKQQAHA